VARHARKSSSGSLWDTLLVMVVLAIISAAALRYVYEHGYTLYYGDATAHVNIARRITDSRTPGFDQLGTVWLPLPHLLTVPLATDDRFWRTGLAGAVPAAIGFILAGTFLFAAAKSAFSSRAAGFAAAGLLALNPNLLYLQSTPITEPIFLACLMAVLYFTLLYERSQSLLAVAGAGLAAMAGTLTPLRGWRGPPGWWQAGCAGRATARSRGRTPGRAPSCRGRSRSSRGSGSAKGPSAPA